MFDPQRLLQQMVGGALGNALGGRSRSRGGGLAGALGGGKAQLGLGLLGVAMAAYEHYSSQQKTSAAGAAVQSGSPMPPPPPGAAAAVPPAAARMPELPPLPAKFEPTRYQPMLDVKRQEAALLVRSMIAAAAADGLIDDAERGAILQRARAAGDDADTLAFLEKELTHPVSAEELVAQTPRSLSEQVYAASALAISIDTEAERAYLDRLAAGLGIEAGRRRELHAGIGLA